jgi:hypothetical protein
MHDFFQGKAIDVMSTGWTVRFASKIIERKMS